MLFLTLEDTAIKASVSTTNVLRFARRMGYEGFTDFQKQIQRDMKAQQSTLTDKLSRAYSSVPREELLLSTFSNDINNINRTMMEMPLDRLRRAIGLIMDAKFIHVIGLRESHALAHYTFTRLVTLRSHVQLLDDGITEMPSACSRCRKGMSASFSCLRATPEKASSC